MRRTESLGVGLLAFAALAASMVSPLAATALIAVGSLDTPDRAHDVEVVGGLAYAADGDSGLRVVDVSNPRAPVEVGALDTPGTAEEVEVVGGLAYVADGYSGLRVIDFGPEYSDADGDGAVNGRDNCPLVENAGQEDSGAIGVGSAPDGIGDACQCGDVSGDGRVTLADALMIQRTRLQPPTATLAHPERCEGCQKCSRDRKALASLLVIREVQANFRQPCAPSEARWAARCPML